MPFLFLLVENLIYQCYWSSNFQFPEFMAEDVLCLIHLDIMNVLSISWNELSLMLKWLWNGLVGLCKVTLKKKLLASSNCLQLLDCWQLFTHKVKDFSNLFHNLLSRNFDWGHLFIADDLVLFSKNDRKNC